MGFAKRGPFRQFLEAVSRRSRLSLQRENLENTPHTLANPNPTGRHTVWPEDFDVEHMRRQFQWLEQDLKAANANRAQRPWIIVTGARSHPRHLTWRLFRVDPTSQWAHERL